MDNNDLIQVVGNQLEPMRAASELTDEEIYHRKIGVIEADIEANCIEHGIRGILEHKNIMAMISEYTEEDKQARVYGKFQHLTGIVFKKFNRRIHVVKPFFPKPQDFCVLELLDPHPRNPDAVMWVAIDTKGRKFVIDELYEKFASVDDMAFKIKQKGSQYRIIQRRADPSLWNPSQTDRSIVTLGDRLHERGLLYIPASKKRTMGIQLINDALDYQAHETNGQIEFVKEPTLYVFETAIRTIWEFEHWQYAEWSGKSIEKKDPSEKPQDKDDHMMENLGRALLDEPPFAIMPAAGNISNVGTHPTIDPY